MYSPPHMLVLWIQIIICHIEIEVAKATIGQKNGSDEFHRKYFVCFKAVSPGYSWSINSSENQRIFGS